MGVTFEKVIKGRTYSRPTLASLWGYSSFNAISRGVVTPKGDNKIILFVTAEKQASSEQYADRLAGKTLEWEGPNDHFAESRMVRAASNGDEIHLFYRDRHHMDFTYLGQLSVERYEPFMDRPSRFRFTIVD